MAAWIIQFPRRFVTQYVELPDRDIGSSVIATPSDIKPGSTFAALEDIFCQRDYAGIGIRLADDQGSIVAAQVFQGSPAAKAGVAANDIISEIDNEPVSGLTPQQITEKLRGSEGTKVLLKVLRKSQNDPIQFSLTREIINVKSVGDVSK
jgi:carboxyl-terminal processing protease